MQSNDLNIECAQNQERKFEDEQVAFIFNKNRSKFDDEQLANSPKDVNAHRSQPNDKVNTFAAWFRNKNHSWSDQTKRNFDKRYQRHEWKVFLLITPNRLSKRRSTFQIPKLTGSRRNLSICFALVLMDMSKTFWLNSTTNPPRIVESIWQKQTNIRDILTKPVDYQIPITVIQICICFLHICTNLSQPIIKAFRIAGKATFCSSQLNLLPLSKYFLQSFFQFFLLFSRKRLAKKPTKDMGQKELSVTSNHYIQLVVSLLKFRRRPVGCGIWYSESVICI